QRHRLRPAAPPSASPRLRPAGGGQAAAAGGRGVPPHVRRRRGGLRRRRGDPRVAGPPGTRRPARAGGGSTRTTIDDPVTSYPVISADSHVTEPPGTYIDHIDPAFLDRAPRLVDGGELGDVFMVDGFKRPVVLGTTAAAGKPAEQIRMTGDR